MKFKLTAAEHQALPADRQAEYAAQADGSFVLRLDGLDVAALQAKVDEFRTTNIAVLKERDALLTQQAEAKAALKAFEGLDPAAAKAALTKVAELAAGGVTKPDDVTVRITDAVNAAVKPLNDALASLTTREKEAQAIATRAQFQTKFDDLALAVGVRKTALVDARRRAEDAGFKLVGDALRAQDANGAVVYRDGAELTPHRWLSEVLPREAGHMFEPTTGGGAPGSTTAAAAQTTLVNPSPYDFGKNLDGIAKGTVSVQQGVQELPLGR